MSSVKDVPGMVSDLVQMSQDYLRQEALGPGRRLGRVASYSLAAAVAFAVGGVLLAVVGMRALVGVLPEAWSWAGYLAAGVVAAATAGVVLWAGRR